MHARIPDNATEWSLRLQDALVHGATEVSIVTIVIACAMLIALFLGGCLVLYRTLVERRVSKHGAGYMLSLLGGLTAAQLALIFDANAIAIDTRMSSTRKYVCAWSHVMLQTFCALIIFPIMAQMMHLWKRVYRQQHMGEARAERVQ